MTITIDTEFKNLIPSLTDEEFTGLETSIIEEGRARVPLNVWNGILLDGHNRFTICARHKLPFTTQEVGSTDWTRTDAMIWIIRNQFNRRNLAPYARAELASKLKPLVEERAAKNQAEAVAAANRARAKNPCYPMLDNMELPASLPTPEPAPVRHTKPVIEPVNTLREVANAAGISH